MDENQKNKVFYITSNPTSLDERLEYSLNKSGMVNLKKVFSKISKYKNEDFTTSVFSFDIIIDDLIKNDFDKERKMYKAIIKLKEKSQLVLVKRFEGYILFKETKNTFIFDFRFEDYKGNFGIIPAPHYIEYTHSFQIKLYEEVFTELKIKQYSSLYSNLIQDSQSLLIGKEFNIDLFLEILKCCYSCDLVKTLLINFNVDKIKCPTYTFDPKEYSLILNLLKKTRINH